MQTIPTDERQGMTSASNAEADLLCPGRHQSQRNLPDTTTADAAIGNRVHSVLAGELPIEVLTADEAELVEKCEVIEAKLLAGIFSDKPTTIRETRLWSDFGGFKHSGKPDAVHIVRKVGLVIDYKTGRNEVAESPRNLQLRDLAVLAAIEYALDEVHVAIIQPWATMTPEVCRYTKKDLILALAEMEARIVDSNAANAPRIPGEKQCQYCKAKAFCPEAREKALTPVLVSIPDGTTAAAIAATLTSETLTKFLDSASFAEKVIDACRDEAKRRITEGQEVPGYRLKDGSVRESITDAQECFNRCAAKGVKVEDFMQTVTIAKGKLKDALKATTGEKGKALDATLAEVLNGITEEKQAAPSLAKI